MPDDQADNNPEIAPRTGYFQFVNRMGWDIRTGWASHKTTDYGEEKITLDGLQNNATSLELLFTTDSTNRDRWSFQVTLADGNTYKVNEKGCGFWSQDSGKTVQLQAIIADKNRTLYISMPSSSDCSTTF